MANNIDQPRRRDGSPASGQWTAHVRGTSAVAGTLNAADDDYEIDQLDLHDDSPAWADWSPYVRDTPAVVGTVTPVDTTGYEHDAVLPSGKRVPLSSPAVPGSVIVTSAHGQSMVSWIEAKPEPVAANPLDTNPEWMRKVSYTHSYTGAEAYNQIVADNNGSFPVDRAGFVITDPDTGRLNVVTIAGTWAPQQLHDLTNKTIGVLVVHKDVAGSYPTPEHPRMMLDFPLVGGSNMSFLARHLNDLNGGKSYARNHNVYNEADELIREEHAPEDAEFGWDVIYRYEEAYGESLCDIASWKRNPDSKPRTGH